MRYKKGDIVIVKEGELIPADGEVVEGAAFVDESAITGESAPVIREPGGDRSSVTGGTCVTTAWIAVKITSEVKQSFFHKIFTKTEHTSRKKYHMDLSSRLY